MQPNKKFITITDNETKIVALLNDLVLAPRVNAVKWSKITKQTPNIKIGYPGQHLSSLITGMCGERTGARGNDLRDGSEVKSCSRIDQLDKCQECGAPVARLEELCPECNSDNIKRNNDSKWLFSIRNEEELNVLLHSVKRIFLIIGDYLNFDENDFNTLRFQAFEIWPEHARHKKFSDIITNYYFKIYKAHKKKDANKSPAPKNFWPYSYQFYLSNPIPVFSCIIKNANTDPQIHIEHYIEPGIDRSTLPSILMPSWILKDKEFESILKNAGNNEIEAMLKKDFLKKNKLSSIKKLPLKEKQSIFIGIDEKLRSYLPLRNTDIISVAKNKYTRRGFATTSEV
jgi:hypothetical protein